MNATAPHTAVTPYMNDETARTIALQIFQEAMQHRLTHAASTGRRGWNKPEECTTDRLAQLLLVNLSRGDLVSVGNYAMMLYMREGGAAALACAWLKTVAAADLARGGQPAADFIEQTPAGPLTFPFLREQNTQRCREGFKKQLDDWTSAQWACAAAGEMGELCNLIKKEFRGDQLSGLDGQIADEIADVVIYLDLLAAARGLDLGEVVRHKFNIVSDRVSSRFYL